MKLLFSFILFSFSLIGFAQADITPQIAAAIAQQMMPQVELTLQGQDKTVSKADAQKMLSGFFSDAAPSNFVVKHQGTSKLDDQYRIGDLSTAKGKFRVTFFMKKDGNAMLIRQLKIEPAD
jgi:phosphopantothenoylcysteine synthetase/decarboxylase